MEVKPVEPFEATMDFSRNNQDRKPWGKPQGTDQFHLGNEYDPAAPAPTPEITPAPPAPPEKKFTHKVSNGETLEAATVEELAGLIEKALSKQAPPAPLPVEFDERPSYTPMEFKRKELSLTEQAEILNLWKENPQKAFERLQEAQYGTTMDTILANLSKAELREAQRVRLDEEAQFLAEAESYKATPGNAKKLMTFINEKAKGVVTKKNLLIAFQQLSATDKGLLMEAEPVVDEHLEDVPPPPTIVPSNQGRPELTTQVDADKFAREFASWPLKKQQEYFAKLRRG